SKEELHLQQLVRELVIADTSVGGAGIGSSQKGGSDGGTAVGGLENFDQISYTIKQIFQSGKQDAFTEQLELFIQKKEGEIEKMCNFHYQEFVQSVDQLLKVRMGTVLLKSKIVDLNKEMQSSGTKIVEKKKEIIDHRKTLLNIELVIDTLQSCLQLLDIANRININLASNKYYSALRMIEDLQMNHLKSVAQYGFVKLMVEYIPILQENVRQAVTLEMTDWFVKIRDDTRKVGKVALSSVKGKDQSQSNNRDTLGFSSQKQKRNSLVNMPTSISSIDFWATHEDNEVDPLDNDTVKVDFRPLYQCLHIHEVLGKKLEFQFEYEENRRLQANIVLSGNFSLKGGSLDGFETYLHEIVGFFIIESYVMNTTHNFRSHSRVETLWESATVKINQVITDSLHDCEEPELFLAIKMMVVNFIGILEEYGYVITTLSELLLSLFDRYVQLMKMKCGDKLVELVQLDEYTPLVVHSSVEYDKVLDSFKITDEKRFSLRYPRTLPFSQGLTKYCDLIKNFMSQFYMFADGFTQQHNEMDDLLKKSLENLLMQLHDELMNKIKENNLSQAVQIIVNLEYLEQAVAQIEEILEERRGWQKTNKMTLNARTLFRESRQVSEKRIFELIHNKIDQFFEIAEYDWHSQPSSYLQEMVNFLSTVISSNFANLPPSMRSYIYFDAVTYLASRLNEMIISPTIKKMSGSFVETFDLDVCFLEKFVQSLADIDVGDALTEVRQTITFLKTENFEEFLTPAVRTKKYSRLKNANVIVLLERYGKREAFLFDCGCDSSDLQTEGRWRRYV
ncbi:exocyst complex subunit Sec15-like-domain-containing protein, partial [Cladochytrium replicatum]